MQHAMSQSKSIQRDGCIFQQKIIPCLWFDHQAEEAANFYTSIFKNSGITKVTRYLKATETVSGKPAGSVMTVEFQLDGYEVIALNGGPQYSFSPAISFVKNCETKEETDAVWEKLCQGGMVLMELGAYPFSEKFGWVQDRFGISWQVNYGPCRQTVAPCLLFNAQQSGKAQEAIEFYTSLFKDSEILKMERYGINDTGAEGAIKHALFSLNGQKFSAMDSSLEHAFTFTPAVSLHVNCETQDEVDRLWERFTQGGEAEACGWLKDRYGVSWQIVPAILNQLLNDSNSEQAERVVKAMLEMVKLDIRTLKQAYEQ